MSSELTGEPLEEVEPVKEVEPLEKVEQVEKVEPVEENSSYPVPQNFVPLKERSLLGWFINTNVPATLSPLDSYVAKAIVVVDPNSGKESDIYATTGPGEAYMKGTTTYDQRMALEDSSWYLSTFVFIHQKEGIYDVYTPISKPDLILQESSASNSGGLAMFMAMFMTTSSPIQSKFVQSGSYRSYQQYKWEVAPGQYLYLDGSDMKISAEASMFIFEKPPEGWANILGTPSSLKLKPLNDLPKNIQLKIASNIPHLHTPNTTAYVTQAKVLTKSGSIQELYVKHLLGKVVLKVTTTGQKTDATDLPWQQSFFVFVTKSNDITSFEVFTPFHEGSLGLMEDTENTLQFKPSDWTVFEFVAVGEDKWYWRIKGENLYLSCDPDTGDITLTEDVDKRSIFKFTYGAQQAYAQKQAIMEQDDGFWTSCTII